MSDFVSASCQGERCRCGAPATHKLAEIIFDDDPHPIRHELVAYVCDEHFNEVVRPPRRVGWICYYCGNCNVDETVTRLCYSCGEKRVS